MTLVPPEKSRAKAKPAAKKKEPVEEAPAPEPEPEPEKVEKPGKETCPDCGKLVASKTLKYSHRANCKATKNKQSEESVAENQTTPFNNDASVQDDVFSKLASVRAARMQRKIEQYSKLTSLIA